MRTWLASVMVAAALLGACTPRPPVAEPDRPNILWILLEDTAPLMGAYGTTLIETPRIDELAAAGVVYTQAIMPAPVCSASRSSIITGSMATTLGLHNHHSSRTEASAIHLPEGYRTVPEVFRDAGYFTFNNGKDDYNFAYDRQQLYEQSYSVHPLYGKRGDPVELATLTARQPFFGQIQLAGGKEIFSAAFDEAAAPKMDRALVQLPPYLPDHPVIVDEWADHLDAIRITDGKVGAIVDELRATGSLENTIVFFFSDHGMRMTRNKQFLYDGGLRVPLIVADFRAEPVLEPGTRDDRLVGGLDLGTSALGLAGITIPEAMEGVDIFAADFAGRDFIVSTRDRCDFTIDRIRSVRSARVKYIRNFLTDRPYAQPTYMDVDGVEFVGTMRQLHAEGQLDPVQARFFAEERPAEELYDLIGDPHELVNLAGHPEYAETRAEYAAILDDWIARTDDQGQYPEPEEGLKLMLGIWGDHAVNTEYEPLRERFPDLSGSQFPLKSAGWQRASAEGNSR